MLVERIFHFRLETVQKVGEGAVFLDSFLVKGSALVHVPCANKLGHMVENPFVSSFFAGTEDIKEFLDKKIELLIFEFLPSA